MRNSKFKNNIKKTTLFHLSPLLSYHSILRDYKMFDVSAGSRIAYRKEGLKFIRSAKKNGDSIENVSEAFLNYASRQNISRHTFRHYRNSIAFTLSEIEGSEAAESFNQKCKEKKIDLENRKRRYRKRVPENIVRELLNLASERKLKSYAFIARLAFCMYYTGIRPGEWCKSIYDQKSGIITVRNSKYKASENLKRGNGVARWLDIDPKNNPLLEKIIVNLIDEMKGKEWSKLQGNASRTLKAMFDELIKQKRMTRWWSKLRIYDFRHQCCANLKAFFPHEPTMVSAMMGHLSVTTAYLHYGKMKHGKSDKVRVKPTNESEFLVSRKSVFRLKKLMSHSQQRKTLYQSSVSIKKSEKNNTNNNEMKI